MLEEGFDITLDPVKGEGCDRLLLAELSIFLIETGARSAPCVSATILSAQTGKACAPQSSRARPEHSTCSRAAPAPPTPRVRCADPSNCTIMRGSHALLETSMSPGHKSQDMQTATLAHDNGRFDVTLHRYGKPFHFSDSSHNGAIQWKDRYS